MSIYVNRKIMKITDVYNCNIDVKSIQITVSIPKNIEKLTSKFKYFIRKE